MNAEEWASIAEVVRDRWIGIDETDTAEWFAQLADLDGGLVTQALIRLADAGETPTSASIRRAVNHAVREQADAAPHPATSGYITFEEWLRRGAPGYRDEEPDREKVVAEIVALDVLAGVE